MSYNVVVYSITLCLQYVLDCIGNPHGSEVYQMHSKLKVSIEVYTSTYGTIWKQESLKCVNTLRKW